MCGAAGGNPKSKAQTLTSTSAVLCVDEAFQPHTQLFFMLRHVGIFISSSLKFCFQEQLRLSIKCFFELQICDSFSVPFIHLFGKAHKLGTFRNFFENWIIFQKAQA